MTILKNLEIYLDNQIINNGYIIFDDKIQEIGSGDVEGIDMNGKILIPGFIDQHTHGGFGHDFMDGSLESIKTIATNLPSEGITSFQATTMTDSISKIEKALSNIALAKDNQEKGSAELLSIHLEGPFIAKKYKGAQREDAIAEISIELFDRYNKIANNLIKQVTVAPEKNGGIELIKYLSSKNIISSIGHTDATSKQANDAIDSGAKCFTHSFNGMSKLHHRDIGAVGTLFLRDESSGELICDLVHVSSDAIKLLYKIKTSNRIILITDSMRAKGLPDGEYDLGGQNVIVIGKEARLADNTLAGSTLKMNDAMKNMLEVTNCNMFDLIKMTSSNAAKLLGVFARKGSITVGKDADLVILNSDLSIHKTYCKGISTAK